MIFRQALEAEISSSVLSLAIQSVSDCLGRTTNLSVFYQSGESEVGGSSQETTPPSAQWYALLSWHLGDILGA